MGTSNLKREKPLVVKHGLNNVTRLIETKKAQLVVIAHDVDPIETVCWLPSLCKTMSVPYLIINGKSRMGQIVHKKTATVLALEGVKAEDSCDLAKLNEISNSMYINGSQIQWGGCVLGPKTEARRKKLSGNKIKKTTPKSSVNKLQ